MRLEMMDSPAPVEESKPAPAKAKHHPGTIAMFALAGVAAVALGAMYFRYFKYEFTIPTTDSQASVEKFLTTGQADLRGMRETLDKTAKLVNEFGQEIDAVQVPVDQLAANPFDQGLTLVTVADESPDGAVVPVIHQAADTSKAVREQQRQALLEQAKKLKLQSILYGSAKSHCLIDGKLYAVGQTVEGFTIRSIERDRITLHTQGHEFVLQLRQ
jgi:ABC-type glycerol-3-phosphate transport system substrate-binding protein